MERNSSCKFRKYRESHMGENQVENAKTWDNQVDKN